ncbi:uncharacterized protein [Aegilops tauschii subsp. strangulata]|uniref:uncharacterized protein isoform X3 n=1 Tax=Aegilops tauschii subsp. strangulata TaxID=200361 RepID=UPI00098A7467|nr:uncharacterized protein LOC109741793 isoform X3 [Aegilops tauschii subsp. strangulata]
MRWKLGTAAYKRVPSRDAAMDPDLETPEKTPEGGGGAGAACPLWRRSLPHVCVTTVTSFLFGYHTGVVNEPLESISTDLGGRVRGVAVAVDDAVRDCRVLQRHIVGRLGGRRRQRRVGRRPCGAADRACRVRRVAARQPQGPRCEGFFVMIWIAAVMFKSNDILRKQTALRWERKMPMLIGIVVLFTIHVFGVYWWYMNDDLVRPLVMLPPKEIPPFWHAIFFIAVNDTMVRQAAMVVKCVLLMYYVEYLKRPCPILCRISQATKFALNVLLQDLDISENLVLSGVDLKCWLLQHCISPSEMLHFYS